MEKTHVATEETLQRVATSLEIIANQKGLIWDDTEQCYTNQSVAAMLASYKNGLAYGVSIPKGSTVACTKTGANAGIAAPTPGYIGQPAIDPYTQVGPFVHFDVNGYVDADGTPHVTAFEGDGAFSRDGSNGNVWVLAPLLWWRIDESDSDAVTLSVSDTRLSGMEAQPQAYLPDGTLRPYMLYAKYAGSNDGNGMMASVSGAAPWLFNVSHNSLITQCKTGTTGYSGKSIADDWYLKVMFLIKYATKNSQSVFTGCTNYNYQYSPAVAETGVTRVILTKAQAANLIVSSSMMLGTHAGTTSTDRGTAANHDVFANCRIVKIEDYDTDNSAVYFDSTATFDTATTYLLSTAPWACGSLDAVEGDGTLTDAGRLNSHEPFKLQGIETMMGNYEILGDVIINSDGTTGWELCINYDSRNEASSISANYVHTGKTLFSNSADGAAHYPLYPSNAGGLLFGTGDGASSTTGMCDATYTNKTDTAGQREWLGVGHLGVGASAGLWCVIGAYALTYALWYIGSRLSGTGRGRAAA